MKKDFYEILGINRNATEAEIKKAYRKKAIEFHPDKNPGDAVAEENFKKAAEAYEILSDPQKKAKYDQYGHQAFENGGGGGGFGGMNMDDIFSQFGDIFGGGGFGGFGGGGGQRRMKGSNLRIKVKLTLEEIANGVEKKVKVKRKIQAQGVTYKTCGTCNGQGQVMRVTNTILGRMQSASTCPTCGGTGQTLDKKPSHADAQGMVQEEETVSIKIPAGVVDGMQLKVSNKGNDAPGNSVPGDLIVAIEEVEHDFLKREGENLHYDLYISLSEAVLGASKDIEAVSGKVRIKLEEGIQSGKILRLKGKGIPSLNGYGNGDLLVHVNVWTPKTLNKEQRQFFEKYLNDENFLPNPEKSEKSFFEKVKDMFS
ncbi:molecular chaperone DnaJ [Flavobacterium branchiophilum]|uniref:Chaperone protein DnaJ n=1 Tax=Flavobacterium branchiophilum TaxID=55197 RepID=A0A543G1A0_9FLAO|nr:molecular chaperone DnaJ [Flavobacterium branchiophilum]OXA78733.1 molecular chaperone DnaJ [Flavobacterium branchiophilum] [Flavobacterium branchiophilum NBRC 15030 = ATCC 35035]TQM39857.1 molecular chaperone DnaJ [Flavobacterium branchiophilum]GEM55192.1 chaperone protein DnaJ [Flavobacterium branchiophilum NBRC 15030 = ATCC 35035]